MARGRLWARLLAGALSVVAAGLAPAAASAVPTRNPIVTENARPGTSGWEISPEAGEVIAGYASEASVGPGQTVHLHVAGPVGESYRIRLFRLGWYGGLGGRLIGCVAGCRSRDTLAQPLTQQPPDPRTGLRRAGWPVSDRLAIPRDAVSGYYEARLELLSGPSAGAVGFVPFIVREATPRAVMLVQVPVNTWQAYNAWGGRSLYQSGGEPAGQADSFDRPYATQEWLWMAAGLELPWVHFLERRGVDVAYQTDLDTDAHPHSLLEHRLVFGIGHNEYWTQRMRTGLDRAQALGTNLMFGSNAGMWRMRYADRRRTIVEWRNPALDPAHDRRIDTGEFRLLGQPECRLMGGEYLYYAHRPITAPATAYTVVGDARQPWLATAGLQPGTVVPGVVGYEWDSLVPGCFRGRLVRLMHGDYPGADGRVRSADMLQATARSGAQVLALGTMELCRALDSFAGGTPDPRIEVFTATALRALERPAPPARLVVRRSGRGLSVIARLPAPDPRVQGVAVRVLGGRGRCADALHRACRLPAGQRSARLEAVAVDRWGRSAPLIARL